MTDQSKAPSTGLGTFSGVFTPSILTILGIILFLRLGYVVGSAGLAKSLVIIAVANLISVLTTFSLAAIATNMKVKGGGDYYLISRTLGIEFGGAIGIVLFLAQSVSIAFYCIGFGEAVAAILGWSSTYAPQIIAGTALVFLFALAWVGADLATKFQYGVMVFLILALASFFAGGLSKWNPGLLADNWILETPEKGFWILFALFFPAVTGFTQGVSMSGDLKDPGKSLPLGTFAAVALSILVYFSVAIVFAASSPLSALSKDYGVMKQTALFGPLIDAGVIAATLSSAMASFLGAPRILQSLASDKIFPLLNPFAKGYGASSNPRRGVLLSFGISIVTILMGELDLIAGIVSMFFLISYGLLNTATWFEAQAQSPSFRPRFKWYHKHISLAGSLICLLVMLAIDFKTGAAATAILFAIFQYLKRTSGPARWADSQRSYQLKQVRDNLIKVQKEPEHPRDWRPCVLALAKEENAMAELLNFSTLIEGKSGMTTAVRLIKASGLKAVKLKRDAEKELAKGIAEQKSHAFPLALSSEFAANSLWVLFQTFGIGPVKANTVLLNWEDSQAHADPTHSTDYRQVIRLALRAGCSTILLDHKPETHSQDKESLTIDVWWRGDDTSRLMLLLAYLITRDENWEHARIRLAAFHLDQDSEENRKALSEMLDEIRISAQVNILPQADTHAVLEFSQPADIVFVPLSIKDGEPLAIKHTPPPDLVRGLKSVAMVMAAQKMDLDSEPEHGQAGELAQLFDELKHAEKRVAAAEKTALEAMQSANRFMENKALDTLADPDLVKRLKEAVALRQKSEQANQKLLKERAKLVEISEQAKEKGIGGQTEE